MSKEFKVWIVIEEIDEEHDIWENVGEPDSLGTFSTYTEAKAHLDKVYDRHSKDDLSKACNRD